MMLNNAPFLQCQTTRPEHKPKAIVLFLLSSLINFIYCKSLNFFVAYAAPTVLTAPISRTIAMAFGPSVP